MINYAYTKTGEVRSEQNQQQQTLYTYDAFGNEKNPVNTDANPFRYCGEYYDKETGTYYLRARYYDPRVGRFTARDTHWTSINAIYGDNPQKINERQDKLGLSCYSYAPQITAIMQAGNLYVYCMGNPVYYLDNTGCDSKAIYLLFPDSGAGGISNSQIAGGGAAFFGLFSVIWQAIAGKGSSKLQAPAVGNKGYFTAAGAPNPKRPDDEDDHKQSYLSKQELNDKKNDVLANKDVHFETKEDATEFIKKSLVHLSKKQQAKEVRKDGISIITQ